MNLSKPYKLESNIYLLSLFILFLNDFILKYSFHNWFTGKISDLVGLFIFTYFLLNTIRLNHLFIEIFVIAIFIFWKSPYSNGLIEWWSLNFFPIGRVVDYSDLYCLIVVPISKHADKIQLIVKGINPKIPIIASLFLFCATSYRTEIKSNSYYELNTDKFNAIKTIKTLKDVDSTYSNFGKDTIELIIRADYCFDSFTAFIWIESGDTNKCKLHLIGFEHNCPKNNTHIYGRENRDDLSELRKIFENTVIKPLGNAL